MFISNVEIKRFRNLYDVKIDLNSINVFIGPNNTGKTSFLEALNIAIGFKPGTPSEDDFYVTSNAIKPKDSEPIQIDIVFSETYVERFSDTFCQIYEGIINFDENLCPEDPIKYIKLS